MEGTTKCRIKNQIFQKKSMMMSLQKIAVQGKYYCFKSYLDILFKFLIKKIRKLCKPYIVFVIYSDSDDSECSSDDSNNIDDENKSKIRKEDEEDEKIIDNQFQDINMFERK